MDPFHAHVARLTLNVLDRYGFALAGGYAVQMHNIVVRPSDDVDFFTDEPDPEKFDRAASAAVSAWEAAGLIVEYDKRTPTFARYYVSNSTQQMRAELCHDWRADPPVILDIGPVLSRDDSVANKVGAVFTRGEARDYIDVHAALTTGGYSRRRLEELGASHDGGFDIRMFSQELRRCTRHPDSEYGRYGVAPDRVRILQRDLISWADDIDSR